MPKRIAPPISSTENSFSFYKGALPCVGPFLGLLRIRKPSQGCSNSILSAAATVSLRMVQHIFLRLGANEIESAFLMVREPALALVWMAKVC